MATVKSLPEVRERLDEEKQGTWDAVIEPGEVSLVQGRLVSPRLYRYEYPTGLTPSAWATGQMCQFLGIPTAYFRRCPVELQDMQFNYWKQSLEAERRKEKQAREGRNGNGQKAERWLVRARNEVLRGVLTEKYVRLDNLELFAALSPALSQEYEVDWFALSDESFHLRLHDRRLFREALPGDRLMAGVHIANSEVGKRAVTVDALIYRLVCTNGLIRKVDGKSLLYQRHIALGKAEFALSVQSAVREALAFSAAWLTRLSAAVAHPIPDVEKAIHKIALDWGLTQATEEAVKAAILLEHPSQHETLYGLINGLTGAARSLGADERYTLETQAGTLLERYLKGDALPGPVLLPGGMPSRDTPIAANGNLALFALP
jgi:hypothetical protein